MPGIALAFAAGGAALVTRSQDAERWLAIPFGIGAALTLDESALLLELEDVYWTEEGILSVQVTLAVIGLLGALEIVRRMLQRGEQRVLCSRRAAGSARRADRLGAGAGVHTTWSRPGPTPIRAIGTPT